MAEPKKTPPAPEDVAVPAGDTAQELGTNAHGVDLNDQSLKGGTDNKAAQEDNERRMQAAAGTGRPVVQQIRESQPEAVPVTEDRPAPDQK